MDKDTKSARLTLFDMPSKTKRERQRIIKWLRMVADALEDELSDDPAIYTKNPRWTLYE